MSSYMGLPAFVLFSIVLLVNGENVLFYDDADFSSKMASHEVALVKFYAPWLVELTC